MLILKYLGVLEGAFVFIVAKNGQFTTNEN